MKLRNTLGETIEKRRTKAPRESSNKRIIKESLGPQHEVFSTGEMIYNINETV